MMGWGGVEVGVGGCQSVCRWMCVWVHIHMCARMFNVRVWFWGLPVEEEEGVPEVIGLGVSV